MKINFIKQYEVAPRGVKASVWFTICSIIQRGISFITTPIFTRLLTTEEYGLFNVFQSWYSIISVFATLNLAYGVFNKGMVKYEDKRLQYISSMQGLSTCVTIILFALYMPFRDMVNKYTGLNTNLTIVMFVGFLFSPALSFWSAKQRFEYKYKALILITLLISLLTPIVGIVAIKTTSYGGESRIYSYILVSAGISLILYIYNAVKGKKIYVWEFWKFALTFNIPLIPHYLSMIILNQSDRIMIDMFCGKDKAGIYSVTYSAAMIMNLFITSINNSYTPWTYQNMKKNEFSALAEITNYILLFIAIGIVILMLFAPEIICILAPEEYREAIWIIPPVAASVFFTFLYTLFGNIEFYFEKTTYTMVASVVGAIMNVILNYIFIAQYGYIAAGYTTLFCYIAFSLAHYFAMRKTLRDEDICSYVYDTRFIFLLCIAILVCMVLSLLLYNHVIIRYIILTVLCVAILLKRNNIINILKSLRTK